MPLKLISNNPFAVLDDQYFSSETAKATAAGQNGTQPAKNNRVFAPEQIQEYEKRKAVRELKAAQSAKAAGVGTSSFSERDEGRIQGT